MNLKRTVSVGKETLKKGEKCLMIKNETILNEFFFLQSLYLAGGKRRFFQMKSSSYFVCSPFGWWLQSKLHLHLWEVQCACMRCMKF